MPRGFGYWIRVFSLNMSGIESLIPNIGISLKEIEGCLYLIFKTVFAG
jgi:hypothetical protein